jgi:hypothetical protein
LELGEGEDVDGRDKPGHDDQAVDAAADNPFVILSISAMSSANSAVIPGRIEDANHRYAIAHRGISRFRVRPSDAPE